LLRNRIAPQEKYSTRFYLSLKFLPNLILEASDCPEDSSVWIPHDTSILCSSPSFGSISCFKGCSCSGGTHDFSDPFHLPMFQNGVVLGKVMQAFESHIPYLLQFFQDFEISGMDWVELDWRPTPFLVSFRLDSSGKYFCSSSVCHIFSFFLASNIS
jgi:hypothetical protein